LYKPRALTRARSWCRKEGERIVGGKVAVIFSIVSGRLGEGECRIKGEVKIG
jgi:hypothetical protein